MQAMKKIFFCGMFLIVISAVRLTGQEDAAPTAPEHSMIARLDFENGLRPETLAGFELPAKFQRPSPASSANRELGKDEPRLTAGKRGRGLLLEAASLNLFAPSQSGADDAQWFSARKSAEIALTPDAPWQGANALMITVKGETAGEGFETSTKVERAFYAGTTIQAAGFVASLYLKGQGYLKLFLRDAESGAEGEAVYVDLDNTWKRAACLFAYNFPAHKIGAKHDADWQTLMPAGLPPEAKLELIAETTDALAMTFMADGLQLEKREQSRVAAGAGLSPMNWMPGGAPRALEKLHFAVTDAYFADWRKNGTISFWFQPGWEISDDSREMIFNVSSNLMLLRHNSGKMQFMPTGVQFTPDDWRGQWHHLAVTWNQADEHIFYLDGYEYAQKEGVKKSMQKARALWFGEDERGETAPNGVIDEVALFQVALTPEQIKALAEGMELPALPKNSAPAAQVQPEATPEAAAKTEPDAEIGAEEGAPSVN